MTSRRPLGRAATLVAAVSLLAAAGCGSSDSADDSSADPVATADAPTDTADDAVASDEQVVETAAPEPAESPVVTEATPEPSAAPADDGGADGEVTLTLSDGRAWTFTQTTCTFDPDATGPAAALIIVDGFDDAGAEFGIIEAWPLDGSTDTGPAFIGTFADESDEVLVFVKDTAMMDGDQLEVTGGYYENVFYEAGDAPDGTYTVRCQP